MKTPLIRMEAVVKMVEETESRYAIPSGGDNIFP